MTAEQAGTNRDALLQQMDDSWERLDVFVSGLSDEQVTGPTDAAGWTVKDHLDHLSAWGNGIVAVLSSGSRSGAMGVDEETFATAHIDVINEAIRQAGLDKPSAQVKADLAATHQALRDKVANLPDEDLHKPYKWFVPDSEGDYGEGPIQERISGNSHAHYDEHLEWMLGIVGPPVP